LFLQEQKKGIIIVTSTLHVMRNTLPLMMMMMMPFICSCRNKK